MLLDTAESPVSVHALAENLLECLEDDAVAVFRYGALAEDESHEASGGRLLLVSKRVDLEVLKRIGSDAVAARKAGWRVRIDTVDDLLRSADTHPVFTLTLMDTRELLAGTDVLEGLTVAPADLRLRIEQSLRSLVHELTDEYLFAPRNEMRIEKLLRRCGNRLVYLLAGLALIKGHLKPPEGPGGFGGADAIIKAARPLFDDDGAETVAMLRACAKRELNPAGDDLHALLGHTLSLLGSLVEQADTHEAG